MENIVCCSPLFASIVFCATSIFNCFGYKCKKGLVQASTLTCEKSQVISCCKLETEDIDKYKH